MHFIFGLILGLSLGVFVSWVYIKRRFSNGYFRINETNPDKDVYKMIVNDFNKLHKRKYLLLRITRK